MSEECYVYGPPHVSGPTRRYWEACVNSAFDRNRAVPDFLQIEKLLGLSQDQSLEAYEELDAHGIWSKGMVSAIEAIADDRLRCISIRRSPKNRAEGAEWVALRATVFERDDYTCTYCGARGGTLECDHVIPVAKRGSNALSNLTTACKPCNRSKRDKLLSQWRPCP